jgi:hypothetical protein
MRFLPTLKGIAANRFGGTSTAPSFSNYIRILQERKLARNILLKFKVENIFHVHQKNENKLHFYTQQYNSYPYSRSFLTQKYFK